MQALPEMNAPAVAAAVCIEARRHGLLTRPIGNVVVLMPPLCITLSQLTEAAGALHSAINEVSGRHGAVLNGHVEKVAT